MHPDLSALLAGAGAGAPAEIDVDPSQHPDAPAEEQDAEELIKDAIDQIREAVSSDGLSENERLILEKITTLGQQLLATREKEHQAAMGGGPATNYLRRASGSQAA